MLRTLKVFRTNIFFFEGVEHPFKFHITITFQNKVHFRSVEKLETKVDVANLPFKGAYMAFPISNSIVGRLSALSATTN